MVFHLIDPATVLDEPIPSQIAYTMNYPFDIPGIRAEMGRLLSKPRCRDFVQQLLASVESPANRLVEGGDVLRVFDRIMAQPMAQPKLVRIRDFDNGAHPTLFFNLAMGSLSNNTARIQIGGCWPPAPVTRAELKAAYLKSDAAMCLHETIHHSGENIYSDQELAEVVSGMTGTPLRTPNPGQDIRPFYSQIWDRELRRSYQ
ncbi:MAG TPA: hypothetical protein VNZ44_20045 [Pyrinomonadaceae bacterium]|nr:hypothetical protein [Pyrinomonadaceae bacterium]